MSEIKLKPCPFCGGKAEIDTGTNGAEIKCIQCGLGTGYIEDKDDYMEYQGTTVFREEAYIRHKRPKGVEVAIEKWNRRAGEQNE